MTESVSGAEPTRRHDLDVLRGIAVALILVLHAGALTPGLDQAPLVHALVSRSAVGMQLFFVLSGYLIANSWDRARFRAHPVRHFALLRLAKIVPLYLAMLHLTLLAYAWQSAQPGFAPLRNSVSADNLSWVNYLVHLLLLQGAVPLWQHSLLDGSWSIAAEVYFYAVAPWLLTHVCHNAAATLRGIFIALVAAVAFAYLARNAAGSWGYYGFPSQLPCFLCGVVVHQVRRDMPNLTPGASGVPLLAICSVLSLGMLHGTTSPLGLHHVYAVLFAVVLFVVLGRSPSPQALRGLLPLAALGRMSYAMFFAHLFLLKLIHPWLAATWSPQQWAQALVVNSAIALFGSLSMSLLILDPIDRIFVSMARRRASTSARSA